MPEQEQASGNYQPTGKGRVIEATLTEKEVAEALGVPPATVKRLRYEGEIPYVKIGRGRTIYLADSILHWLKSREKGDGQNYFEELAADLKEQMAKQG